ncbi:MAG: CAP domain-containing protein [Eubacteriales bacterium]
MDTSTAYISSDALSYINAERVKLGLSELTYKSSLGDAAKIRAVEASTYFAHTRPDGSSPSTVYSGAGSFGECLAMGQTSAYSVVYGSTSWSTSTTHWTALMNSKYTYCAIAYYKGSDGIYYWAALLSNY